MKRLFSLLASLLLLTLNATPAKAVDMRVALVEIVNETNLPMVHVEVAHKYSDVFKDNGTMQCIRPGQRSGGMQVRYHTGAGTLGRDWWVVSWGIANETPLTTYLTSPANLREGVDLLEKIGTIAIPVVAAATSAYLGGYSGVVLTPASKAVVHYMLNGESTAGFKQHILREEDANRTTLIVVKNNNEVEWRSPSGTSTTGWVKRVIGPISSPLLTGDTFDESFYLTTYPDVREAFCGDRSDSAFVTEGG